MALLHIEELESSPLDLVDSQIFQMIKFSVFYLLQTLLEINIMNIKFSISISLAANVRSNEIFEIVQSVLVATKQLPSSRSPSVVRRNEKYMLKNINTKPLKNSEQMSILQMRHTLIQQRYFNNTFYEKRALVMKLKICKNSLRRRRVQNFILALGLISIIKLKS